MRGDSTEYDLLQKWVSKVDYTLEQPYVLTCEVGVREGYASKIIMDVVKERGLGKPYRHIGIDPYGMLDYQHYDQSFSYTADYSEEMKTKMKKDFMLGDYNEFVFMNLTDKKFMKYFKDGVPIYEFSGEFIYDTYDFVHLDGPHMTQHVLEEAIFFAHRMHRGSLMVLDDYPKFNYEMIKQTLGSCYGLQEAEKGENKVCLVKL